MNKSQIKEGRTYETKVGIGVCVKAGGCHPWAALIDIKQPFPRGKVNVVPRDVIREIETPTEAPPPTSHRGGRDKPYVENYPPLHKWLREHEARCDWQLPLGGERDEENGQVENPSAYVECWRLPTGHAFVVVVTKHGWDLFTSAGTNDIAATLADANIRLGITSESIEAVKMTIGRVDQALIALHKAAAADEATDINLAREKLRGARDDLDAVVARAERKGAS